VRTRVVVDEKRTGYATSIWTVPTSSKRPFVGPTASMTRSPLDPMAGVSPSFAIPQLGTTKRAQVSRRKMGMGDFGSPTSTELLERQLESKLNVAVVVIRIAEAALLRLDDGMAIGIER
jgi:hypothetical protein